jgi:hypothetical protein
VASRSEIFVTDMYRKPTRLERVSSLFAAKPLLPKEDNTTAQRADMMGTKMIRRLKDRNQYELIVGKRNLLRYHTIENQRTHDQLMERSQLLSLSLSSVLARVIIGRVRNGAMF